MNCSTVQSCKEEMKIQNVDTEKSNCENVSENEELHLSKTEETILRYDFSLKNIPKEYEESYTRYINEVRAIAAIPIIKSIPEDYITNFKHFNLRYYEDKYCTHFGVNEGGYCDINIRIHTNKLMLVALASGNDIVRNGKRVVYISFVINDNDRSNVCLSGKKKKGSKAVERGTILCQVKVEDDDKLYNIRSGVSGGIIEINELLKAQPDLIRTEPKGVGFIAVLAPKGKEPTVPKYLLTEDEYIDYLMHRPPKCPTNLGPSTSNASI